MKSLWREKTHSNITFLWPDFTCFPNLPDFQSFYIFKCRVRLSLHQNDQLHHFMIIIFWTIIIIQPARLGLKGPEGTFRPFGPAGVLRRRLLHRNGTFVPPAPPTRTRRRVKTDFRRKTGRSGPFFHQSGRFQGVERAKFRCRRSHLFGFSRRWPESGRFGRFSGPRGPTWRFHFRARFRKHG